ncbi:iron-containing alcohol dehydrogenase family protein [Streptomyces sp. NPDC056983]|uniref:iron-containing alcohol dehydrogenase family protein n=1 Tax=Streptomyces sp. NPDC056983 TaxID=3345987 RepID=UPI003627A6DB
MSDNGNNDDSALNLRHITPAFRTHCGPDALRALPRELTRIGARRVVVIGTRSIEHSAAMARLRELLGEQLAGEFHEVDQHSPLPAVERARAVLAEREADAVVAVGGGSSVVTARAASILLAEGRDIRELATHRGADGRLVSPRLDAPKLPQWVVPTTPTTAYAKAGSAVRDPQTGERLALYDPKTRAQGVILDPDLALTAPPRLAWSAALDVFCTAVEGLQARHTDPLADALLAQTLRTVTAQLPRLLKDADAAQPRLHLMLAALMSGQGSDHTGGGLTQALAHAIGPRSSAANGVAEAILLPHVMRFNIPAVGGRLAALAELLQVGAPSADRAVEETERLLGLLDAPTRLRDIGVAEAALEEAAEHALQDWAITGAPRVPGRADLTELLAKAW